MANTYHQCYIQVVFAVKFREALITNEIKETVEKYISGIIANNNQKMLAIYCNPDHIHILISHDTKIAFADLVRDIKANSSKFINENNLTRKQFRWQEGFGVFSYSRWDVQKITNYILNQEEHHRKQSFREEYLNLLEEFEIDYDARYLFEFFDE